ncbi:dienelactone hydrolase [Hahella sp. CCB-MM4]|uniref:dienelactone hydrolase family protein n=1 Tax=Hahella sp. (strain CCB-MM4) TaxID=1926491 RepID=UPI000B9C18A8|nr:dienelactone hydrolase family protein [Hahella sp. CCB-MM4]OZG69967.1 dienelactone hydrolase [Hahella sp. CCB-MM4]
MNDQQPVNIPQIAFDWYDEYAHGDIDRRTFLARLGTLSVAGLSLSVITSALTPDYALAEQVSFNDPDILATYEEFDSPKGYGKGRGYFVKPKALSGKGPAVLVVHENRGLNPYIEDVARRLAKVGYIAFAPDALYTLGGYPGNDDQGREMQKSLDRGKIEQDFMAAAKFLKSHPGSNGKLGVVGFCFGGYITNMLAATLPEILNAAVPFYGTPAQESVIGNVKGPLLLQFAELDNRVNATWPSYEALLKEKKVDYQAYIYPGVNHGFHNDSTGRYDKAAAELAWSRTLEFFKKHLG